MLKLKSVSIPSDIRIEVTRYREWLNTQGKRTNDRQKQQDYIFSANRAVTINGKTFIPFAPFREEGSALKTITVPQRAVLIIIGLLLVVALLLWHWQALAVVIGIIIFFYLSQWILNIYALLQARRHTSFVSIDQRILDHLTECSWPSYTILCPLYKEGPIVVQFIKAMEKMDYPTSSLQILLLTEEDDNETRIAIDALGGLPAHFQVVTVPRGEPRTKPRACNYGLLLATGSYVVIYDAEDIPEPTQLKKAVLTFAQHGPELACVQAQLNFYNPYQNLLTRLFTIEYSQWFDLMLPALQHMNLAIPLGGTSNHFRTSTLRTLGGWDAFNVTEDADLGMRLSSYHLQTVMLESTTYEEANPDLKNWIRQRSRWLKGYMQTYLIHMRHPVSDLAKGRGRPLFSLQLLLGGTSATILINPLMVLLLFIYIAFRSHVDSVYRTLFPAFPVPVLYAGVLCMVFGNFYYLYIAMLSCTLRKQYNLVVWCLLLPFYWLLMSVAALKAGWQLIIKPHYWEKTQHGLHLKNTEASGKVLAIANQVVKNSSSDLATEDTVLMPLISKKSIHDEATDSLSNLSSLPAPAVSVGYKKAKAQSRQARVRDVWLYVVVTVATIYSILAVIYYYRANQILAYGDGRARIRLARSLFDSQTPGFAQLGLVWLPLHLLSIVPFVWNDFLWRSGLAGAFPSMAFYILGATYLYKTLKMLTRSGIISFIGTLVYIVNPNVLYVQSIPLSEMMCTASFIVVDYYFLMWAKTDRDKYLVVTGILVFVATLIRYDGWALAAALIPLIFLIGVKGKLKLKKIFTNIIIYSLPAFFGIMLWILWNKMIEGNPLFFQNSQFTAQQMQIDVAYSHALLTKDNIVLSFQTYIQDSGQLVGWAVFWSACVSLIICAFIYAKKREGIALCIFLVPFSFYVLTLYIGQSVIYTNGAEPGRNMHDAFTNVRYATPMVVPTIIFTTIVLALFFSKIKTPALKSGCFLLCILAVLGQSIWIQSTGVIIVQEVTQGCHPTTLAAESYIAQHYDGDLILADVHSIDVDARVLGLNYRDVVNKSNNVIYYHALERPDISIHWVVFNPSNKYDDVAHHLNRGVLYAHFRLVLTQSDGLELYLLKSVTSLPNHPLPTALVNAQNRCGINQ